ncbi:MAG: polymer-forming cytoskeletal protein, partial [Gemmatimonadota bacterium]
MSRFRNALAGLALLGLLIPAGVGAQNRDVVSKEVAVGRSEATLRLEFTEGSPLEISLRDGSVYIDGELVGSYQAGDALDATWRSLLGNAVSLEDGPLSEMLRSWTPPEDLPQDRMALAERMDDALRTALTTTAQQPAPDAPSVSVSGSGNEDAALVQALLGEPGRLAALEDALQGVGTNMKLHVKQDVDVGAGETVQGTLVVVQGDVRVAGTVDGDLVVVDGTVDLVDGGRITGDVRLAAATLHRDGGTVSGDVVDVQREERVSESELRDRIREEIRREVRAEVRNEAPRSRGPSLFSPFRNLFRGIGGIIENLVSVFVLGLVGMGVVAFAPRNLDAVAEAARRSPGRAAMVGVAGSFLLIPVWILGAVALAVSIVGIPVMIAWLPLFPLAAVAAGLLGYLAVARNVGEWLADSGYRYTDWIRRTNPVYTVFGGLLGLAAFFIAGNALSVVPFFGWIR